MYHSFKNEKKRDLILTLLGHSLHRKISFIQATRWLWSLLVNPSKFLQAMITTSWGWVSNHLSISHRISYKKEVWQLRKLSVLCKGKDIESTEQWWWTRLTITMMKNCVFSKKKKVFLQLFRVFNAFFTLITSLLTKETGMPCVSSWDNTW